MASQNVLKHRPLWIVCGMTFVVLVVYLSLTPDPIRAPTLYGFKAGHIAAYAWLGFWFWQVYPRTSARLGLAVALCLLGIALEYVQAMVGRDFAYSDMRDDAIGVALGFIVATTPLGGLLARMERAI